MSVNLKIHVSEQTGLPYASIPGNSMWELVEYLAAQRTPVLYGYGADGFTVTFQRLDNRAAQELLDDWAAARMPDSAYQEAAFDDSRELCYLPG
jgi:hypothetical protein